MSNTLTAKPEFSDVEIDILCTLMVDSGHWKTKEQIVKQVPLLDLENTWTKYAKPALQRLVKLGYVTFRKKSVYASFDSPGTKYKLTAEGLALARHSWLMTGIH